MEAFIFFYEFHIPGHYIFTNKATLHEMTERLSEFQTERLKTKLKYFVSPAVLHKNSID